MGEPRPKAKPIPKIVWALVALAFLLLYPAMPFIDKVWPALGFKKALTPIFIFGILALALNLQVGSAGLL